MVGAAAMDAVRVDLVVENAAVAESDSERSQSVVETSSEDSAAVTDSDRTPTYGPASNIGVSFRYGEEVLVRRLALQPPARARQHLGGWKTLSGR